MQYEEKCSVQKLLHKEKLFLIWGLVLVMLSSVLNKMLGNGIDQDEITAFGVISRHREVFCHVVNDFSFFRFFFPLFFNSPLLFCPEAIQHSYFKRPVG